MGWKWEVDGYCIIDTYTGERWGWAELYKGQSIRQALKSARRFKKETDGAVRILWR